ncbi:MAG TPA: ABC transporter permease [Chitinophagaceae bacterium]|nr:ABC transporter permease [Chitinophagaceae bacterium]
MVRNYLLIAWRNVRKSKLFSFINITGLAIGMACFLLIALFVLDELSYDRYNEKADRIYRINALLRFGGSDLNFPLTADPMGAVLKKDYPEVEDYVRIYNSSGSKLVKKGNDFITERRVAHADSTLFNVFTLPAIEGDTKTALNAPNTVVITESMAKKYFGTVHAVGKTLETNDNDKTLYKVTAVIKDIPHNSHFNFDFFFSMKNVDYNWNQFTSHNFHTYLLLKPGTDYKAFEKNFDQYINKYVLPEIQGFVHIKSMSEFEKAGNKMQYSLIPLTQIHLYSNRQFEFLPPGSIQYVYIFSAVALFILLIACINFMNLTTARSANRAKEVGIRKVLGTERKSLVAQFLAESTLMALISTVLAIAIAYFVLPLFNTVAGKSMTLQSLFTPVILPLLIILPFIVGLLAGIYPAFFLSAFKPIEVLKGRLKLGKSGGLRSALVVFQFMASIALMIGTIVIYRQLHYIQTINIGFNKDQVLIIDNAYTLGNNVDAFKQDVLKMAGVKTGTLSGYLPVSSSSRSDNVFSSSPEMNTKNGLDMQNWRVDYDYINTFGMQLAKGRNFSREYGSDSSAVILNETAAQVFNFKDPIGQKIYRPGDNPSHPIAYTVIGVVKNFNFESLKQNVGPLGLFLSHNTGLASFKVTAANAQDIVKNVERTWKTMAPGLPFSYRFLDDSFNDMYSAEQRIGTIVLIFSVLAIVIACLGLFGLSTYIAEQRTKEIGIRKVLGASVSSIVQLLSKDFMLLVLVAFVIAAPVAWWGMNKWLADFAYRTAVDWWIFALAAVLALGIALATMSFQAIRAALMNPVKSLRTE